MYMYIYMYIIIHSILDLVHLDLPEQMTLQLHLISSLHPLEASGINVHKGCQLSEGVFPHPTPLTRIRKNRTGR